MLDRIVAFVSDEGSLPIFILFSLVLGGGAAWLTGRSTALNWQPWWRLVASMLILAAAVRFVHFALFESMLLSAHFYLIDSAVCLIFGLAGFRVTRVHQMVTRYKWINERASPFHWRRQAQIGAGEDTKSG